VKVAVAVAALASLALATVGSGSARPATRTGPSIGGFTIVDGRLVGPNGFGVTGQVWLFLQVPPVGDQPVSYPLVAASTTNSKGEFALAVPHPDLASSLASSPLRDRALQAVAANGAWANFELLASAGKTFVYQSLTRHVLPGDATPFVPPQEASPSTEIRMGVGVPGALVVAPRRAASADPTVPVCIDTVTPVGQPDPLPTELVAVHLIAGESAVYTYGQEANTTIGVPVGGSTGSFSVSGDVQIANDATVVGTQPISGPADQEIVGDFSYQKYRHQTVGVCPHTIFTTEQATQWNGDLSPGPPTRDPSGRCTVAPFSRKDHIGTYGANGYLKRSVGRAVTFKTGVSLLGIGVDTTTDYSHFSELDWYAGRHKGWRYTLCGDTTYPAYAGAIYSGRILKKRQ
jgi:hypothetical protein